MTTFAGLFWYEIVLLVLGVLLFIVLLSALRTALASGKSYVGLLPFFVLTIAMIGYPSIKSIQYKDGLVEIDNETNQIESSPGNPENAALRQTLDAKLKQFSSRAANPQDARIIARARSALKARTSGENSQANGKDSNSGEPNHASGPTQSQNTAELRERVLKLTQQAEENPKDAALRNQLVEAARQLKAAGGNSAQDEAVIKRAQNFLQPWGQSVN